MADAATRDQRLHRVVLGSESCRSGNLRIARGYQGNLIGVLSAGAATAKERADHLGPDRLVRIVQQWPYQRQQASRFPSPPLRPYCHAPHGVLPNLRLGRLRHRGEASKADHRRSVP
jgi:hypothetical protein